MPYLVHQREPDLGPRDIGATREETVDPDVARAGGCCNALDAATVQLVVEVREAGERKLRARLTAVAKTELAGVAAQQGKAQPGDLGVAPQHRLRGRLLGAGKRLKAGRGIVRLVRRANCRRPAENSSGPPGCR